MIRFLAAVWLALFALPVAAQTFPELTGRVVDQADLLRPEQEAELASKLAALEAQSGRQMVVATVASLEGLEIEDYGTRLGRHWTIGDEQRDDGVILLVAPNERKVRIETGYGAEGVLPDILAGRIIRDSILPRFKAGDMPGGIVAGADAVIAQLQLPPAEAQERIREAGAAEAARGGSEGVNPIPVIFMVVIFFVVFGSIARAAGGRRYRGRGGKRRRGGLDSGDVAILLWGLNALSNSGRGGGGGFGGFGGGGGGGFGGFSGGGGSFGGGGASGGW